MDPRSPNPDAGEPASEQPSGADADSASARRAGSHAEGESTRSVSHREADGSGESGLAAGDGDPAPVLGRQLTFADLHPRRFFLETWRSLDREAARERQAQRSTPGQAPRAALRRGYDYRPLVAFGLGALWLTLMEYFGAGYQLEELLRLLDPAPKGWRSELRLSRFHSLMEHAYWAAWRVAGYLLMPALTIRLVFRERLRDYGLNMRGTLGHAWLYALFYLIVLALVVLVSFRPDFTDYYPFYKQASRSWFDFLAWELLYAVQFLSLEFFFRGFWLFAAQRSLGSHAIFAMVVPYCMIHYGKPWLEAVAAIIAGIVLGTLAMRTRSIASGFLIHVAVAVSMDVASLLQGAGLPARWWPKG